MKEMGDANKITGYGEHRELYRISTDEILYFEAVGEKVFAYTEQEIYEIKNRLYQIEEKVNSYDFTRASKSMLVNTDRISSIASISGSRGKIMMDNGEAVIASRMYYKPLLSSMKWKKIGIKVRKRRHKMSKKLLLINDMAGYGKVALSAMIPVLSHMKYEVFNLPTAIVSNTLDYGKFDILDTTDYMKNAIAVWEQLGFEFDAISTGFIVSKEQTELVTEFCKARAEKGVTIFTDPIMGDEGKLYNGITEETIDLMRELISAADYIVPNYTEAAYLTELPYKEDGVTEEEYHTMIDKLRAFGAKSIVITSAKIAGTDCRSVVGYDHKKEEYFKVDFEEIPVHFPGTGDIFSAVFIGKLMSGKDLQTATAEAMDAVKSMISKNADNVDKYKGIPLETCMEVLD